MSALLTPSVSTRSVDDLQRELLAICRGHATTIWRDTNGVAWCDQRAGVTKHARINQLRRQILAIDPKAATYVGWEYR